MSPRDLKDEFEEQFKDVVTRLQSKDLFQSDWDIASFAVFFIFIGKGHDYKLHNHLWRSVNIIFVSSRKCELHW